MPVHGDERNRSLVTHTETNDFVLPDGKELTVVSRGYQYTAVERWCAACGEWIECRGIMGHLRFHVEHDEHAEVSA